MWIQYDTETGFVHGSNSHRADSLPEGRAQIEVEGFVPRPFDGAHFSPRGAVWASEWLLPTIEKAGEPANATP